MEMKGSFFMLVELYNEASDWVRKSGRKIWGDEA